MFACPLPGVCSRSRFVPFPSVSPITFRKFAKRFLNKRNNRIIYIYPYKSIS
nr:MAG TPA: Divergent CCT motif [Caudoviricetes sp.]